MMTNRQKNALLALAQENEALRHGFAPIAAQIAALEEQVFSLETSLRQIPDAAVTNVSGFVGEAEAPDPFALVRENVCLRAKLDYAAETIERMEKALLHLCDALERP